MSRFWHRLSRFAKDAKQSQEGQSMVSYVLLAALLACGATAGMSSTASGVNHAYTQIASDLASAIPTTVPAPAKSPKSPKTPKTPKKSKA